MHIREKIAHVIDVKHLKHETLAKPLGISRQAFSKRLKHGNFTDREITILAKEMNMEKEALENVDPQRTEQTLQGVHNDNHTHNNNIVLSYVMNLTFNGMDDSAIEKIVLLVKDLQKLQQ